MSLLRPDGSFDARFEFFYDGTWNRIPNDDTRNSLAADGGVEISRGRPDESGRLQPTSCTLSLNDQDGRYTIRNPFSPLHGKVEQNTPIRVSVGEPHLGAGTGSEHDTPQLDNTAPSLDAAKAGLLISMWTNYIFTTFPTTSPNVAPGSMTSGASTAGNNTQTLSAYETISSAGSTGTRTSTNPNGFFMKTSASVFLNGDNVVIEEILADVDSVGDGQITLTTGNAAVGEWLVAFYSWSYFQQSRDKLFPDSPNDDDGGWIPLANSGLILNEDNGVQMRAWARYVKRAGPQTIRFYGIEDANVVAHAHVYRLSNVDPWLVRATTEMSSSAPQADSSGADVWVRVSGGGILRRIEQRGDKPFKSPLYRVATGGLLAELTIDAISLRPLVYWPLEDQPDSTSAAPGFDNGTPMTVSGEIDFGTERPPAGSDNLPDLLESEGSLFGSVPIVTFATSRYYLSFLVKFTGTTAWPAVEIAVNGGPHDALRITFSNVIQFHGIDGATATLLGTQSTDLSDGRWYWFDIRALVSLGNVNWSGRIRAEDGQFVAGGEFGTTSFATTPGTLAGSVAGITVNSRTAGDDDSASIGHIMMWPTTNFIPVNLVMRAFDGYLGERAGRRLERLCNEQMIPFYSVGDLDDTREMGPQVIDTFPSLMRQCEDVDSGILYEPKEEVAMAYRTLASLYNRQAIITFENLARGEVVQPLMPVDDDQQLRNDVTAVQITHVGTGDSARAVDETGPLGVNRIGRYDVDMEFNVMSPNSLKDHAGWQVLLGTIDQSRYPIIVMDPTSLLEYNKLTLFLQVASLDPGDRIVIENPPVWLPNEVIDQLALGFNETLHEMTWDLVSNNMPALPFSNVGVYGEDDEEATVTGSRYDTDGSRLEDAFTAGVDTTAEVFSYQRGSLWAVTGDEDLNLPIDVRLDDVRMRVTDIDSAINDQFTRVETNGWGSTPFGQPWVIVEGSASTFSTTGSVGQISPGGFGISVIAIDGDWDDCEILTRIRSTGQYPAIRLRVDVNANDGYEAAIEAGGIVSLWRVDGGSYTPLSNIETGPAFTFVANDWYWLRMRMDGNILRARAWPDNGTRESDQWYAAVDGTYASGGVGCALDGNQTTQYDSFELVNPQRFTFQQTPVNARESDTRLITPGTGLSLWAPARYGL